MCYPLLSQGCAELESEESQASQDVCLSRCVCEIMMTTVQEHREQ